MSAGLQYLGHWIAEHFTVALFDAEQRRDPGFVEFTKGGFIAGVKKPENNLIHSVVIVTDSDVR
ncbi:MAG TPA: hypothetical protein VFC21_12425 [Bryobacteraceae bacterium]|nr:hypothetical protein [Bryobacteraceae bacterium]